MKKSAVKPCVREKVAFRPHVETLECRAQPGSMLGLGASLLGAAALDLNSGIDLGTQRSDSEVMVSVLHLSRDNELALHVNYQDASQARETAPVQVAAATSSQVRTNGQSGLSVQDQARSVAAHAVQGATTTHQSVTLTQAPVSSRAGVLNQGQTVTQSQSNTNTYQAEAIAVSAQSVQPVSVSHALRLQSVDNIKVTSLHKNGDNVPPPDVNPFYISYLGTGDGPARVNGNRANPAGDGSSFVTGAVTDPFTGLTDGFLGEISSDGSTIFGGNDSLQLFGDPNGNFNVVMNGVDVGQDGSIYVVGTATAIDGSGSIGLVARVEPDVTTVDWQVTLTIGGQFDGFNNVRDGLDPNVGEVLAITGTFGDPNTGSATLAVVELSNLQADPTQLQVAGGAFAFNDPNGNEANTVGKSIAIDANGSLLVGAQYGLNDNSDSFPLEVGVPSGITGAAGRYYVNPAGATLGAMTGVDVDPTSNIAYFAGTFRNSLGGLPDHGSVIVDAVTFDPSGTFTPQYNQGGAWIWSLNSGTLDWAATGTKVVPGSGGVQAINSTANDPTNPGGTEFVFRVGPTGDTGLDLTNAGFGSNDDQSTAIDVQADPTGSGNDYFVAGYTNSPDFSTTANSFQPSDPDLTGTFYEGWVADLIYTPF